jgi:subtilisin family serine protease
VKKLLLVVPVVALALVAVSAGAAASPREHLFVGFGHAPGAAERALVARHGGTVRFSFPSVNALAIDLSSAKVGDLARESGVRYVEQDPERHALQLDKNQLVPAMDNGLYGLITTRAVNAHSAGFTGAGVKACVADTGLDANHPDIAPNWSGIGFDAIDNDSNPVVDNNPFEAHGTHVAGTVLAANNGVGVLGVAYNAQELHARVLADPDKDGIASGSTSQVMAGVQFLANQGCKVVNLSLGGGRRNGTEENLYKALTAQGTLIVAAAGNDGTGTLNFPAGYPIVLSVAAVDRNNVIADFSSFGKGLDLAAPGVDVLSSVPNGTGRESSVETATGTFEALGMFLASPTAKQGVTGPLVHCGFAATAADCVGEPAVGKWVALISRGNVTFNQKVTSAMDAGASAAIVYNNAPGNFSGTLGAEKTADGRTWIPAVSISQADGATLDDPAPTQVGQDATVFNLATDWDLNSGTSMATPHVSGVAALVFGANPNLTPAGVEQILKSTAKDLGAPGYDTTYGFGIPQADAAADAATP